MAVSLGAGTALARSAFDFDPTRIRVPSLTRTTNPSLAECGTVSATNVWLGAEGRIEISVTLQDLSTQVIFAQGANDNNADWELLVVNKQWRLGYKGEYSYVGTPVANTRYDIVCERKDGKLSLVVNGEVLVNQKSVDELETGEGLTFFHRKSGGKWNNCPSTMKFHSAKIYNAGVLVADYVPFVCMIFGSGGLMNTLDASMDDVTGAFSYDWTERMTAYHELFCSPGTAAGGTNVDWVAASGREFVQTDFVPDSTDVVRMKVMLTARASHYTLFSAGGAFPSGSRGKLMELLCLQAGTWRPSFDAQTGTGGGVWTTNTLYEVEYSQAGGVKVNGSSCGSLPASTASFTPTYGLTFFSRIQVQSVSPGSAIEPLSCPAVCRFHGAQVYAADGTTLKADFVPYVDGAGYAGIRDVVSGKVYLPLFGRLTASTGARPAAVYLAPDSSGDDTNAGTPRSPYRTIGSAVSATANGGTVYLKDGIHVIGTCHWLEGDLAHALVGASGDPAKVVIDGNSSGTRVFVSRNQAQAAFRNLTFRNCRSVNTGATIYSEGAVIENCVFTNNEIAVSNESGVVGGVVYAMGGRVSRCVFRDNRNTGNASLASAVLMGRGCLLENCLLEGNVCNGPEGRCCTVYLAGGDGAPVIRNCTFVKNRTVATDEASTAGIRCDTSTAQIVNTVFCGNEHSLGGSLQHAVVRFMLGSTSLFTGCAADYPLNARCPTIQSDVFADWSGGDYAPHARSRLISRGVSYLGDAAVPADYGCDLVNNPRFVGETVDIGAYEWQGRDPTFGLQMVIR